MCTFLYQDCPAKLACALRQGAVKAGEAVGAELFKTKQKITELEDENSFVHQRVEDLVRMRKMTPDLSAASSASSSPRVYIPAIDDGILPSGSGRRMSSRRASIRVPILTRAKPNQTLHAHVPPVTAGALQCTVMRALPQAPDWASGV